MNVQSQLVVIGSSAKALIKNYGGRTKEGSQTGNKGTSTPKGAPLPP